MNEYLVYLAVMTLVIDVVIMCTCILPRRLLGKTGYGWRKILWLVLAVRLLIPIQTISSLMPVSITPVQIKIEGIETGRASEPGENTVEEQAEATEQENGIDQGIVTGGEGEIYQPSAAEGNGETYQPSAAEGEAGKYQPGAAEGEDESYQSGVTEQMGGAEKSGTGQSGGAESMSWTVRIMGTDWQILFLSIWLIAAAGLLGIRSVQYQVLKKKVLETSAPCRDVGIKEMVRLISVDLSLKRKIHVRISREIRTPMLFGYYKPVILLPRRMYHEEEAEMILRHEIQHYKNHDLWYKFLIMFVCDLYWFNPFLRLMKRAAYQDIECICDEKVVRGLDLKNRKIYASTILETAAQGNREVAFGTHFSKGKRSIEVRIRNIFSRKNKWGYVLFGFLLAAVITGTCLWNVRENISGTQPGDSGSVAGVTAEAEREPSIPVFDVDSPEELELPDEFHLEDYYITNRTAAGNRYYIDGESVLWGYGGNDYGQLGNGQVDELGIVYSEPIRIDSEVVSVDMSNNGYFCIYLTSDGRLYGMGSNLDNILGMNVSSGNAPTVMIGSEIFPVVTEPTLIAEDVAYARAGMQCIVYLKNDGSVWWQGRYGGTSYPGVVEQPSGTESENVKESWRMRTVSPHKLLDNCIYVTTGRESGAAISADGELYTWGRNIMGECGTPVTGDDFVREPVKVLDNVQMVWADRMCFNSPEEEIPEIWHYNTLYDFNMFVRMKDGTFMATGKGLGTKETKAGLPLALQDQTHRYSDTFVPIRIKKYSEIDDRNALCKLEWGMRGEEACRILDGEWLEYGVEYMEYPNPRITDGEQVRRIRVEGKYILEFDAKEELYQIYMQEGGSRDQKFSIGMTKEEVEELTGPLEYIQDGGEGIYLTEESVNGNYYGFYFYDGKVSGILECEEKSGFVGETAVRHNVRKPQIFKDVFVTDRGVVPAPLHDLRKTTKEGNKAKSNCHADDSAAPQASAWQLTPCSLPLSFSDKSFQVTGSTPRSVTKGS